MTESITPPRLDKFLMIFSIIDILFFPYFFGITITYSFVFVFWYYFRNKAEIAATNDDYGKFRAMCILMILSACLGFILDTSTLDRNATYCFQYIVSFMHLYVFKYYFDRYSIELKGYLMGFVFFVTFTAVVFMVNRGMYFELRSIWSPKQSAGLFGASEFDFESIGRFGFMWMDENNIAYMLNSVVLFLVCNERLSKSEKLLVVLCDLFVVINSMSRGGMFTFYLGFALYVILQMFGQGVKRQIHKKRKFLGVAIIIGIGVVLYNYLPSYFENDTTTAAMERLDSTDDTRSQIYSYIIKNTNFLEYSVVGHGVRTLVNGMPVKPHNIHLYYILVYGIIAWALMIYILFRKRKQTKWIEYIWVIPFFLGASANIIIGEEKAMDLAMLLIAASISPKYLIDRR